MVHLDEVAGRVLEVHLYRAVGEQVEAIVGAVAPVAKEVPLGGGRVDGLEVVDRETQVVVGRGGHVTLEEVQLLVLTPQPLHGDLEVRRRDRFHGEDVFVELFRLLEVVCGDTHVVELECGHAYIEVFQPPKRVFPSVPSIDTGDSVPAGAPATTTSKRQWAH